ncbi:hypothetical protein HG264_06990 [Pseudomonas sp. gcc21]|uniref:hypothetical protein n=1 Tax=Pseudomonas sp. gcc21 TaxID=2726989 RepID=UPI0014519172|nr:hypothetical protein [Pseudomonas sp. gcc21]QJD58673.1 hypothetical protein HG264_06990 [Pseudomonas sp. gcc21]
MIRVVSTGGLPPPVGGVTVFLKYFSQAIRSKKHANHEFIKLRKLFLYHDSILHINCSNEVKRLVYVLIGKLFFDKVFIVKHGGEFELTSLLVKCSLFLVDGVFCLNQKVRDQLIGLGVKTFMHSTIFRENQFPGKVDSTRPTGREVLLYINNSSEKDRKSVYGADFILDCLDDIVAVCNLTIIDLSRSYRQKFEGRPGVSYIDEPQDFMRMVREFDLYIRPTRSDGMSVALLEAGLCGVKCLASDVVDRPGFVFTYELDNKDSFLGMLNYVLDYEGCPNVTGLSSIQDVLDVMRG